MKVFVYSKKSSKKIAMITSVVAVEEHADSIITFTTKNGNVFSFDTKEVKTTTYQN